MFPLSDDNPRQIIPYVSWTILALCVAVFLWQISLSTYELNVVVYRFGMIPARLMFGAEVPSGLGDVPAFATVFTSMFIHGDLFHLLGNMLFLWIFGDNIEESMGHKKFLAFYLVCGAVAASIQAGLAPASTIPMIGASGAISGLLGAYILLHPYATVRVLFLLVIIPLIIRIPAVLVLGLWFAGQIFSAATTPLDQPGIAFWAHVGGFGAGLILVGIFKHQDIRLFQAPRSKPFKKEKGIRFRN